MIFQIALVLYLLINYLLINKQAVACIKSLFHQMGCCGMHAYGCLDSVLKGRLKISDDFFSNSIA